MLFFLLLYKKTNLIRYQQVSENHLNETTANIKEKKSNVFFLIKKKKCYVHCWNFVNKICIESKSVRYEAKVTKLNNTAVSYD